METAILVELILSSVAQENMFTATPLRSVWLLVFAILYFI